MSNAPQFDKYVDRYSSDGTLSLRSIDLSSDSLSFDVWIDPGSYSIDVLDFSNLAYDSVGASFVSVTPVAPGWFINYSEPSSGFINLAGFSLASIASEQPAFTLIFDLEAGASSFRFEYGSDFVITDSSANHSHVIAGDSWDLIAPKLITVPENTVESTVLYTAQAVDADVGDVLSYSLGGADASELNIESSTGNIRLNSPSNYELQSLYEFQVIASDGALQDTLDVVLEILDVNEAPKFASSGDVISVDEVPVNESSIDDSPSVVYSASASDEDNDTLHYSLSGDDVSAFSIDPTSGDVSLDAGWEHPDLGPSPDYESQSQYQFTVTAYDGTLSDSIDITLNISDLNDPPWAYFQGGPPFTNNIDSPENSQDIGSAEYFYDEDGDNLSYSLSGTDAALINIDTASGVMRFNEIPDHEVKDQYLYTVEVSDGSAILLLDVTLNIADVNESPQFNVTTHAVTVEENLSSSTVLYTPSVVDPDDSDTLIFTLSGDDSSYFSIDPNTAEVRFINTPDFEQQAFYDLEIVASDSGGLSDSTGFTVSVSDVEYSIQNPTDLSSYFSFDSDDWKIYADSLVSKFGGTGLYLNFDNEAYTFPDGQVIAAGEGLVVGGNDLSTFQIPDKPSEESNLDYHFFGSVINDYVKFPDDAPDNARFHWSEGDDYFVAPIDGMARGDNQLQPSGYFWRLWDGDNSSRVGVTIDATSGDPILTTEFGVITGINYNDIWDGPGDDIVLGSGRDEQFRFYEGGSDTLTTGDGRDKIRIDHSSNTLHDFQVTITDLSREDYLSLEDMGFDTTNYRDQFTIRYDDVNDLTTVSISTDSYTQTDLVIFQGEHFLAQNELKSDGDLELSFVRDGIQFGTNNRDYIYGIEVNDEIYALGGDDWLYLSSGDDIIDGGEGYDRLDARSWNEAITVDLDAGTIVSNAGGNDQLRNVERIIGTQFDDVLIGGERQDQVIDVGYSATMDSSFTGEGGDDYIEGRGDHDFVWYGRAPEAVQINLSTGIVSGGEGNDTLVGIEWITGSNYSDDLIGSDVSNRIYPDALGDDGAGTNYLVGGADYIDGGEGIDILHLWVSNPDDWANDLSGVDVNMMSGTAIDAAGNTDIFVNIENVYGTAYDDQIVDDAGSNKIETYYGNDVISLSDGDDWWADDNGSDEDGQDTVNLTSTVRWSAGAYAKNVDQGSSLGTQNLISLAGKLRYSDVLDGGSDTDIVNLTSDSDALFLDDALSGFHEWLVLDHDSNGRNNHERLINLEVINAGDGDDLLDMTSENYSLEATSMTLSGGAGDDILWAAEGDDVLNGGDGNDVLNGSAGDDVLSGGDGSDVFEFLITSGSDRITDYDASEGDILRFFRRQGELEENVDVLILPDPDDGQIRWSDGENEVIIAFDSDFSVTGLNIEYELI